MSLRTAKGLWDHPLVQCLALGLAILACYYGLWNAYFASADDFWWSGLMRHRSLGEAFQGLGNGARFLHYAAIWAKARLHGLDAAPYYWGSLIQHALVAVLVYGLVGLWTRQRATAFLAALLFATKSSYYEVVTGVSASFYSLWAIVYLATLALFAIYLERRGPLWYWACVGMATILTFAHDYALTLPLMLLAHHLILGRASPTRPGPNWSELRLHVPFWILWGLHVAINMVYVVRGTSEAVYSEQGYGPGWHQIANLFYLVFLLVPNAYAPPIYNFFITYVSPDVVRVIWQLTIGLAIVAHLLAIALFWKGSARIRIALALTYLTFLPYTLWQGDFAGAFRYLYLPSIGVAMLLAIFFVGLHDRLSRSVGHRLGWVVPGLVALVLAANFVVIRVWVDRHIENSQLRRAFVTRLEAEFRDIQPGAWIYIEVPQARFVDLQAACRLVFSQPVNCRAFVLGERSPEEMTAGDLDTQVYWLRATPEGFDQVYPPVSAWP